MAVTRADLGPPLRRVAERVERQLGEVTTTHIPAVGRVDLQRLAVAALDDAELSRLGAAPAPVTACPLFLPSLLHPGAGTPTPQLRADGLDPRDAPGADEADQVAVMHGGGAITFTGEVVEGVPYVARRRMIAVEPKGSAARPHGFPCVHADPLARLGDHSGVDDAVGRAAGAMASLRAGAQPAGLFSFSPAAQEGCAGAAYLWAGMPDLAQAHILPAIALNGSATEPRRGINPLMAQLDLAATFVHLDEPERACSIASEVLGVPRSRLIDPMVRRAEELAAVLDTDRYRTLPAVVSLAQEIQAIAPRAAAAGLPPPR